MSMALIKETVKRIDDFLSGKSTREETWQWAINILTQQTFGADELLLEEAITALACLHDADDRLDTANEDLIYFRNCLLEKTPYAISVEFPATRVADERTDYTTPEED
ncbi:MAG: hypothetical protein NUW24_01340 [Anaerolineae bacterium]|jgi:hypothetical protein|nr:hypothetical protein [Anaerolineae bacterium]MDH7475010.1 hypothetical protein [Anaerolineae bacterium]